MDLLGYRERHAQLNSDHDLGELRRLFPIVAPRRPGVENNYANLISQRSTPSPARIQGLTKRRAAAYQAYYEFMPCAIPASAGLPAHSRTESCPWATSPTS